MFDATIKRNFDYSMRKSAIAFLMLLAFYFSCNFNPEEPSTDKDAGTFIGDYEVKCLGASGGTNGLNANNIKSLSARNGDKLWIATWGGGVSSLDKNGTYTTYKAATISSDFCASIDGDDNVAVSCVNGTGQYTLDFFNGTSWSTAVGWTLDTNPVINIRYSGSRFYLIKDRRTAQFLDSTGAQSTLFIRSSSGANLASVVNTSAATSDWQQATIATPTIDIDGQAVAQGSVDRDGDFIMIGYFSDDDTDHANHFPFRWNHLSLHRRTSSGLIKSSIKPIQFGQGWQDSASVYPLAIAYEDRTVTATPFEKVYLASQSRMYVIEVVNYNDLTSGTVNVYTTNDGMISTNVREMALLDGAVWAATDKGIAVLQSNWESITQTSSDLVSNNVQTIATFNNSIYAGTDAGLCQISKKATATTN